MDTENIFEDFQSAAKFIKKITLTNDELTIIYKNGKKEKHLFENLQKVTIITTDQGPFEDDVFWLMLFKKNIIMIPQGCPGEDKLLEIMQKLPDFDNEQVVKAMTCSENSSFLVWEKEE